MYQRFLVPYDGSDHARHAFETAIELASLAEQASVAVLAVVPGIEMDDPTYAVAMRISGITSVSETVAREARERYYTDHRERVEAQVANCVPDVPSHVSVEVAIEGGRAQDVIVDYAFKHDIDCIVMGCRGLGAVRGALGSVSYAVLRSVEVPVHIVK